MAQNPRVIIVGSGPSGYAAACKLLENNYTNVTILEAENRIGGRVHSVPYGKGFIDLGGQWCHGEKGNKVYEMVKDLNLLEHSLCDYKDFVFLDSSGNFVDKTITDTLVILLFNLAEDSDLMKGFTGSFGDYITQRYYEKLNSEHPQIDKAIAKQVLDWYHKIENNLNACANWFDLSLRGFTLYTECEGDQALNWKDQGYKTIFSVLKKEIPHPGNKLPIDDKILLNKEVIKINWNNPKTKEVSVECSDGSKYVADHVIVTISLGVLKHKYNSLFVPNIPEAKRNAIEGVSFGCVNKVFLKFPKKWWSEKVECGISLAWKEEDKRKVVTEFPDGPQKEGISWLSAFFGFHPVDYHPETLLAFYNGDFCEEIEKLPDDVVQRGCMYLLRKFVGKNFEVPDPVTILRSAWRTNDHFRGSYSFHSLKTDRLNTSHGQLAEPLGNNKLLFAGEATHPSYFSTVHGAVESGFREAQRIISLYNSPQPKVLRCNIAVIGAGISGLGAAVTLAEAGCTDILVLEAQDTPGGRIQSLKIADGYVDLGAQWLHGDKNALWRISHENGLISPRTVYEGRGPFLREDGYKFNDFLVEKVNFIVGRILEDCEEFVDSTDVPDSVGKYLEEKFGSYLKHISKEEMRLYLELYDWNVRFQVIDNSCNNLYNVSAKFWGRYFCPTSEGQAHINYSNGHASVVDVLVNKLPKNKLLLSHPVVNIDWNNSVKIKCQNSTTIEADAVIVTCSLGVLKNRPKLFSPSLPGEMKEIITAMGFAGVVKLFLLFEERWWDNEEGFQLIFNYDNSYGDDWCRYLSGFDPVLDQPRMLLGWVGGRGAELIETVSEEEIGRRCAQLLRGCTGNKNITNPVQVIRSTWSSNPWVLGGYSHTTPKCDRRELLPEVLQQPIRDSNHVVRVLLAGEHTHPKHFSTTHGAFESGIHQARVLLAEGIAKTSKH